jgi:phage antirepressor YoqD-like protein
MFAPRRPDADDRARTVRAAARLRREEVAVAPSLSDKLADRCVDLDLVAEAYALEGEARALRDLTQAAGTVTITNAAKIIGVSPKRLVNWMIGNDWAFREGRDRLAAHQRRLEAGTLRQRVIRLYRSDGTETMGISVLVTAKGLVALAKAMTDPAAGLGPWKGEGR